MAAITATFTSTVKSGSGIYRWSGTGTANQADTLTNAVVPNGCSWRLLYVSCSYSAAPTQGGVTVEIDSGLGAGFDTTLATGAANAQDTWYQPDEPLWLLPGDAIRVSAPAAGGVITAAIEITMEAQ